MRLDMRDSIIRNRDIMFLPAYELQQISSFTTPYEYRLNNENYPIEDIYKAASLSGNKGKKALRKKILLLHHSNKIVRYWAAIALKSNNEQQLLAYKSKLVSLMNDNTYLPLKIVLASVCYDAFSDKLAKEVLIHSLNDDAAPVLKQFALQLLIYQKTNSEFIPAVEKLLEYEKLDAGVKENAELFMYVTKGKPLHYSNFW